MLAHFLTTLRMALAALFAVLVAVFRVGDGVGLAGAVVLTGVVLLEEATDLLDGIVARRMGTAGKFGGIYDPMSDSLSRLTIFFAMAMTAWVTFVVPFVMVLRDIVVSYTRVANAITGGRTSARLSGKLKAIVQGSSVFVLVTLAWLAQAWGPAGVGHWWVELARVILACILVGVTGWSMIDYLIGTFPAIRKLQDM